MYNGGERFGILFSAAGNLNLVATGKPLKGTLWKRYYGAIRRKELWIAGGLRGFIGFARIVGSDLLLRDF